LGDLEIFLLSVLLREDLVQDSVAGGLPIDVQLDELLFVKCKSHQASKFMK